MIYYDEKTVETGTRKYEYKYKYSSFVLPVQVQVQLRREAKDTPNRGDTCTVHHEEKEEKLCYNLLASTVLYYRYVPLGC
jgi:hypothetical protein